MDLFNNKMGIETAPSNIVEAYRINTKYIPKPILVTFDSKSIRDKIFKERRAKELKSEDKIIHINEHMTRQDRILLAKTKKAAKDKGWKHAWYRNGKILVKKTDNQTDKIVTIKDENSFKLID